jgi:hypothetical protein
MDDAATIDDPAILMEIGEALKGMGSGRPRCFPSLLERAARSSVAEFPTFAFGQPCLRRTYIPFDLHSRPVAFP